MNAQESYFALLRSALWGGPAEAAAVLSPEALELTRREKTRGLVFEAWLRAHPETAGREAAAMQDFLRRNAATHLRVNHILARLVRTLRDHGIEGVLLKGQGAASCYRQPLLRECGDIDFYVGEAHYRSACRLVDGMAGAEAVQHAEQSARHYHICVEGVPVEIHRTSELLPGKKANALYRRFADKGLHDHTVQLDFEGVAVSAPADDFNAFYLFHHAWLHFLRSGVGLRQLCDWACFLHTHAGRLDSTALGEMLRSLGLESAWQTFACIAVRDLGLPEAEMPFYAAARNAKSRKVLQFILKEGNFGQERTVIRHRPKNYLHAKVRSLAGHLARDLRLFPLFPSHALRICGNMFRAGFRQIWIDFSKNLRFL